jgi:centrosomal protein CEP76
MASAEASVRAGLHQVMSDRGLYERARVALRESLTKVSFQGSLSPSSCSQFRTALVQSASGESTGDVFDALRDAGLVDELLEGVKAAGLSLDASTLALLSRTPVPPVLRAAPAAGEPSRVSASPSSAPSTAADPPRRFLRVAAGPGRGRAFLAHLDGDAEESEDVARGLTHATRRYYVLHLFAGGARWQSSPVPVCTDPVFGEEGTGGGLVVDLAALTGGEQGALPPLSSLLDLPTSDASLNVVVTLVTQRQRAGEGGEGGVAGDVITDVVGQASMDWRSVLGAAGGAWRTLLPVPGVGGSAPGAGSGSSGPIPLGLLPLSLSIEPAPSDAVGEDAGAHRTSTSLPHPSEVDGVLAASRAAAGTSARTFFAYAKAWWAEYRALHPTFRLRAVRIFGETEGGEHLPAPSFLLPLQADRVLDSPAAAARFVSLLPFRTPESVVGGPLGSRAPWRSVHATLAARGGDATAHALLLASLLLGFGLDAYVAVGTLAGPSGGEEEVMWVVTRYPVAGARRGEGEQRPAGPAYRVVFWDPATGGRSSPGELLPTGQTFSRVACLFSATRFYACCAGDDAAATLSWDVEDALGVDWKGMDGGAVEGVDCLRPAPPVLAPPSLDGTTVSLALEAVLKAAIARYRESPRVAASLAAAPRAPSSVLPHATAWDSRLSYLLSQALAAYETERTHGIASSAGIDDFAVAVKRAVPRGSAFRGFPVLFNHASPGRMLDALLAAPAARDILEVSVVVQCTPVRRPLTPSTPSSAQSVADGSTSFALRVAVSVGAEDTTATWLMLAVRTASGPA